MEVKYWQALKPGDVVDVIAPAGRVTQEKLTQLIELLMGWGLRVNVAGDIFGDDLLCANSDEARFEHLRKALWNAESKAVICARGGYGVTRLMPMLFKLPAPPQVKMVLGMSDITALQIFLQQQWGWASLHGSAAVWHLTEASLAAVKQVIMGDVKQVVFDAVEPLNQLAKQAVLISSVMTGGNLCLVQTGLGTAWQIDAHDKILLLEETNERGYKVDRMLEHLTQAGVFAQAQAIVLGDFIGGEEPDGSSLIQPVLQRFAENMTIPVVQIKGIGHGKVNYPIPLGVHAKLQLGADRKLIWK